MKKTRSALIVILIITIIGCLGYNCGGGKKNASSIDHKDFVLQRENNVRLSNLGKIRKIIKLETCSDSVMGGANFVKCDKEGNFYIGDYNSSQKVFCFDGNGRFLRSYGRRGEGPGELRRLLGFDVTSSGDVIMMDESKILKINKGGNLVKEKKLNLTPYDAIILNDLIYVSVLSYRTAITEKKAIVVLNSNFDIVNEFAPYDSRLEKYMNLPRNIFAKKNDIIYFLDFYDLRLNLYNSTLGSIAQIKFPSKAQKNKKKWMDDKLDERDINAVRRGFHRFNTVMAYGDNLFMYEYCQAESIYDFWLLNLTNKKGVIYPYSEMGAKEKKLFFGVSGSYKSSVIVVLDFETENEFKKFREEFPTAFKDVEFNMEDNPILAIFDFNSIQ